VGELFSILGALQVLPMSGYSLKQQLMAGDLQDESYYRFQKKKHLFNLLAAVMKKQLILVGILLVVSLSLKAQRVDTVKNTAVEDTIAQRIILIGDAGQLTGGRHPVVDAVRRFITLDKKTTVLFLGDNLYKHGLPDDQADSYIAARAVLDSQLSVADSTPAKVYMIPGNHDWENGGRNGYDAIIRQQLYVDFLRKPNVKYYPEDGCPGPVEVSLGNDVTLILFDSQWWLHPYDKPEIESDCPCKTREELVTQIEDIAARNSKKLVLLACHHPFKSNGTHGGYYTLKQHLFPLTDLQANLYIPLPILGSAYPISRAVFGSPQDLKHPIYADMVSQISAAVKSVPNLVFVSGHDHNLQHIKDSAHHYIVSGGGCKISRTSKAKNSLFNSSSTGFSVMEVSKNKNVTITFYTVTDGDSVKKEYSALMFNFTSIPVEALDTNAHVVEDPFVKYKDTLTISASKDFPLIGGMRRFFMGQNYRAEWSKPVNMKVFNMSKEKGGMTIIGLGGGKQTKSLRLRDKKGREWVLRSMNKSPTKAIPEAFRGTLAEDLVTELNSASHPYGSLTFPALAKAIDVPVPKPELFFVPDDPALGFYRPLFANNVCMLEEKNASPDGSDTKTTAKVFDKMLDENDHLPDQQMVLRARLLDIVTGDFDRHFDQWRWGINDTGKGKTYYPIPRDRDQAYFYSDGAVLKFVSSRAMPFLKGFQSTIPKVNWLGYSARDFDRIFLTDLDKFEWQKTIAAFQQSLSDTVIRSAVKNLPPEIFAIDGETMIKKLISRRDRLPTEAMKYYRFISQKVNVIGSNQREHFLVSRVGEGLRVRVYALAKGDDTSFIMYSRVFNPDVTKEIRLYGLNDDDLFTIDSSASSRIKIRIIGGKGNDTFDIKGKVEALLYDLKTDGNFIKNSSHAKNRFSLDPPVNERSVLGFNYNTTKLPRLHLSYNSDDGLLIGGGISRRTYGFRNLPYASDQKLSILYAPNRKAYQLNYRGEFNHITRNNDLLFNVNFSNPALRNFTGFSNSPDIDKSRNFNYYTTRYRSLEVEALIRKRFFDKLHLMIGPYFQHYQNKYSDNIGKMLGNFRDLQLDSANTFSKKNYAGAKLGILIDNRNKEFFPTRGMHWYTEFQGLRGLSDGSKNYIRYTSDMSLYASFSQEARLVAILKAGGGHIYSKNYEFFQGLSLGANNGLNGFRKNQFTGSSVFYSSLELKIKLFDVNSFVLPGPFGINTFYDIGRVWQRNESSSTWHSAYGAGVYYMPFNLFAISAVVGFSSGERMFNFTLGTKFNLTY
jgi:hypothetical protein